MVGLSQRLMHAVNFRGDEGYILPRHPLSFSSGASTSASYQAPSSSTRAPFPPSSSTRPSFASTASAPYLSQLSAFYAIGTCFFFLVIFFRDTMTSFLSMTNIYFYRETMIPTGSGVFDVGRSFTCSAANVRATYFGGRDRHPRDPLTYPTHHMRGAQRAAIAAKRKEHQDPPRPTKRGRI
jgi:hypothetical protein